LIKGADPAVPHRLVMPFGCGHLNPHQSVYLDSRPFLGYVKK
jgi:hypothetical protein